MAADTKIVRLKDYIVECDERNTEGRYGIDDVMGMTITKEIIPTKANVGETDLSKFLVVHPNEFVYNPRTHGKKIGLGINNTSKPFLISWNNTAFRVKDDNVLDPQYLYMYLCRNEWDREACFRSWGSSTEVFSWDEFGLMRVPLPSIETQRKLVTAYNGLKNLAEQNEALIEPLSAACNAAIVDCKQIYNRIKLGKLISDYDMVNRDKALKGVRSISVFKEFRETNAKVNKNELSGYKIVPSNYIAYVQTTKNEKCFANAWNTSNEPYVVSSVDKVISSNDENVLLNGYLHIYFRQEEFDRYAIFNSWGSAREVFTYDELCNVEIPLPPLSVQQSIVNLYNCFESAKQIASEAREQLKTICPALIQMARHTA